VSDWHYILICLAVMAYVGLAALASWMSDFREDEGLWLDILIGVFWPVSLMVFTVWLLIEVARDAWADN
jgi:hypothetical protein